MAEQPGFEDHFSEKASDYAFYRPRYPVELYAYLAALAPDRKLAWDCGTGNGQAAIELARHFERVIATDASEDQIKHAFPHERVEYRVEPAEEPSLEPGSASLITVAIAVHWFDLPRFYAALRRVAAPGAILAVWTYHQPVISPPIDELIYHFYKELLGPYWPERFRYQDDRYRSLPFPFKELEPPKFEMQAEWTLAQLAGFIGSWSASQRYQADKGFSPIPALVRDIVEIWPDPDSPRLIRWPLYMRVGRTVI